jgi:hypothetical protein
MLIASVWELHPYLRDTESTEVRTGGPQSLSAYAPWETATYA